MLDENKFWHLIESAWELQKTDNQLRLEVIKLGSEEKKLIAIKEIMNEKVVPSLDDILENLSKNDLVSFDRILEEKLFKIDREDVHYYLEGSDDGFLYNRGFIVGMGKDFYKKIDSNPFEATRDNFFWYFVGLECQSMCFIARDIYRETYGKEMPKTNISRESLSNREGWPSIYPPS